MTLAIRSMLLLSALAGPATALAQATVKPDGQFRYALGAGASYTSGNTSASSANVAADGVRATTDSKWQFGGKALYTRADHATTAENATLGTQFDSDFTPQWFSFTSADYLRDEFANIGSRWSAHTGLGRHVIRSEATTFDVSAGVGYTRDRYINPADIDGRIRTTWGHAEVLVAEESSHRFTPTTTFRQKFTVFPALSAGGSVRSIFDTGLAVAMTPLLSLTVGLTYRYDTEPGAGLKRGDTLFVTGISVKID